MGKLLKFKEKYGHTRVPQQFKDDPLLGAFVKRQRKMYKKMKQGLKTSGFNAEKALKLSEIGFLFDCSHDRWKRLENLNEKEDLNSVDAHNDIDISMNEGNKIDNLADESNKIDNLADESNNI